MKCSCCGKRKGLFDSYAPLDGGMMICIKCDTVLCKIKDAAEDKKPDEYKANIEKIRKDIEKNKNTEFSKWFDSYVEKYRFPID